MGAAGAGHRGRKQERAAATVSRDCRLWSLTTGTSRVLTENGPFSALAADRHGRWLVVAAGARVTAFRIGAAGDAVVERQFDEPAPVRALAIVDGDTAATLLSSGALGFTDLRTGHAWVRQHNVSVLAPTGRADGLIAIGADGTALLGRLRSAAQSRARGLSTRLSPTATRCSPRRPPR